MQSKIPFDDIIYFLLYRKEIKKIRELFKTSLFVCGIYEIFKML
jgi:hypothetical protein